MFLVNVILWLLMVSFMNVFFGVYVKCRWYVMCGGLYVSSWMLKWRLGMLWKFCFSIVW